MTNNSIPEQEIRSLVRDELSKLLGLDLNPRAVERRYYPTETAWRELGYESKRSLYNAVASGLLRVGHEVQDRRKPGAKYSTYYFDIEKCAQRLSERPERRK